ncbi:hypothetical protein Kpol_1002p48 [Vanderwaltozyma polyspora DSM 70294]|uniref:S-adenosyl-L-methionine-dependent tRNA 4-demethylwyosine synthase n=1 Tax=Vanderwaltozyma polyspora (strain ATCC 22028 / DSM 70294 / BCRC 21397 / CBS 2163 / NBRC 10782 / NRRL Y-8283 / UCD 57-17) TaxID=436907 RepID=A7TE79_VANPO|nr:uncharacterized protein Kpol_1002p48 [Vanderwaltozyma polyspora DSM 70294]EDO19401.1 hypothetical protein Kpol_1002p48 [Vanderwaltozyma polyspora DSM 70294]
MELNKITSTLVGLLVSLYLYFGGRFSIAFSIVIVYSVVYDRDHGNYLGGKRETVVTTAVDSLQSESKPKKKCCGGKNGGCCSTKSGAGSGGMKSSCCGGACKSKKLEDIADEIEKALAEQEEFEKKEQSTSFPVAVDFTQSFKPKSKGKKKKGPAKELKRFTKSKDDEKNDDLIKSAMTISNEKLLNSQIYVFYSSLQGAAERNAKIVHKTLSGMSELSKEPKLLCIDELDDLDDYFVEVPDENSLYVFILPSYDTDCPLDYFLQTLEENFNDFRIDKYPLRKLVGYTVLGLGDSESWPEKFCYQAKKTDHWIARLGGRRVFPVGEVCMKLDGDSKVEAWANLLADTLKDDEPILYEYDETVDDDEEEAGLEDIDATEDLVDLEDIGKIDGNSTEIKKMVAKNSPTYKQLTKQGYTIVGSHSGVKICRWTKSDLRGTGSCYKQSLFNIVSSRCMEMTPSLACSSKCVFCWRHGTNPVSKNWRWETDDPEYILENALQGHYSKIKQMRGVPGVIAERFAKAFKVRHCALSLVGEPIMYPYINKYVELLHEKEISSFLVCNAQHPDALRNMGKVTQLYVSIDASTKSELKKVDRPLYKDFWERMVECLDILKTSQSHQRTVFRLTLVKGFNMGDISSYADLVQRGLPCFIEVKGATFAGSSAGNGNPLTMQNIPFYEECISFVKAFTEELNRRGLGYGIAAEHAHSNCILIASNKFKIEDEWYTHIDFDKFFELLNSGEQFTHLDYMAKTPEWALFGNGGFAPGNTRVYRKGKNKNKHKEIEAEIVKTTEPIAVAN